MRSFKFIATVGLLAALPLSAANAEWYVSGKGGMSFLEDADGASVGSAYDTQFDPGPVALGNLGYDTGMFRYEGEVSWRGADIESLGGTGASGDIDAWALMGNVVIDFSPNTIIKPYLGFGVGAAYVDTSASRSGTNLYSGDDWVMAYQVFLGAEYELSDNWALGAEYRMFNTTEYDAYTPAGGKFDAPLNSHNILVGLTYRFGQAPAPMPVATPAPAPAPVAQPAPVPASNFLVFFDWNKDVITPAAREVLVRAAATAKKGQSTQIALTGHTDRSGGDGYNMKLSMARAEAVRAELASLGLNANIISLSAKGESDPLVQTQDGIREPQNRRVEILIP
jgi:outer membrane protein OmpA-like peptidoglycan-associated protein